MRATILLCLTAAASLPALGGMVPLPVEQPLVHTAIVTDLRDDVLEVVVDDEAEPTLRVVDAVSGEASEGYVSLEVDEALDTLRILRPYGDAVTAPPLRIQLVVSRSQSIEMIGAGFDATVSDPYADEDDEGRAPAGATRYTVRADDARVSFRGVSGLDLSGSGSSFDLSLTASPLAIALDAGRVDVEDHLGDVRLEGESTDLTLVLTRGNVRARLAGGSIDAREGLGTLDVALDGGTLRAETWEGSVVVDGEASLVEVSNAGSDDSLVQLSGPDHTLVVENFRGGVIARMTGGEARLSGIAQRVQLTAEEATRAQIDGVGGEATLKLSEGASVAAARIAGELEVQLADGEISAEEVRDLDVRVTRSRAKLASHAGRVRVRAMDSDVSLSLESQKGHQPLLEALGSSRIVVSMREPCAVSLRGDEEMADLIDAGGCDLRVSGRRASTRRASGPVTLVTARVAPGSSLEISSR